MGRFKEFFKSNRKRVIIILLLIICLLLGWWLWPPSSLKLRHSAVVVEDISHYELRLQGKLINSFGTDTTYLPGVFINNYNMLPTCRGRLIVPIEEHQDSAFTRSSEAALTWVRRQIHDLDSVKKGVKRELAELNYYLRTHGVQDEGYQEIAKLGARVKKRQAELQRQYNLLKGLENTNGLSIKRSHRYEAMYISERKLTKSTCKQLDKNLEDGYIKLQLNSEKKPIGAIALSLWPWIKSLKGQAYIERYGKYGFWATLHDRVSAQISIEKDYKEHHISHKYTGYGVAYEGDSVVYAGMWKDGKREGEGEMKDAQGRHISGLFEADTLYRGTRTDKDGVYRGDMNKAGLAVGHGSYTSNAHVFYEGKWTNDERNGFGFAISTQSYLQAGEWKHNVYKGERLTYTSERIYGIDISRFQHDIGKKKYSIKWNQLRITHLGSISKKRVKGKVNYPISFIYIKASEGVTVRNRYFLNDYQSARSKGFKVGAYHFFSTTSAPLAQAKHFMICARFHKGDMPPVLDLEPSHSQIRKMGGVEKMWAAVRIWLRYVEKETGSKPILYISQIFVNKYLPAAPDIQRNYQVWIARYGEYKPDIRLAIWQLSPDGRVDGITGEVDINVFNGYGSVYNSFLKSSLIKQDVKVPVTPKKRTYKRKRTYRRRR